MKLDLDELEVHNFSGRTHDGLVYMVGDTWVLADGNRDSAQAIATLLEPVGDQGWTVVLEKRSREDEYQWGPVAVGADRNLSYLEAEQVAYAFQTEGEVEFDFHQGIALSINGGVKFGQINATISERYDERRAVYIKKEESGWFATGGLEKWDEHVRWFILKTVDVRFPEQGYADLATVRAKAYEWAIQPALRGSERATAWWLGRSTDEVLANNVTYFNVDHAA